MKHEHRWVKWVASFISAGLSDRESVYRCTECGETGYAC